MIAAIAAAVSAGIMLVSLLYNVRAARRGDVQQERTAERQLSRIETVLDGVRTGVDDIRLEMRGQQRQINDLRECVARVEESAKSAHRRLDEINQRERTGGA